MEDRTRRIIETALELAEEGGFEAVRMRDVAAQAGVALGTFYKRFRSKEDLLVAALEVEMEDMQERMAAPLPGATPYERVCFFFETATKALCRKPNLAKAVIRAVGSGDPDLAEKVTRFHDGVTAFIVLAMEGAGATPESGNGSTKQEDRRKAVAHILQQVWFAALVGWTGGLHNKNAVIEQVQTAAELLLRPAKEAA